MAGARTAVDSAPAYLVWEDLTAMLPVYSGGGGGRPAKKILQGLNGYALPGRIMAIMGPSGSGKSTLLDSLSGRLGKKVVLSGRVLLNGKKRRLDYGVVAYVTQENVLLGTLTVRESIAYSAHLRLPKRMTNSEVRSVVEGTIEEMGLQECADRFVGNWHLRGISGGEKKRLSIALEILTRPRLLFLDEPTSGLDSAAAFFVVQALRQMAVDGNRTIISSIHQPSSEVFALFDDLCLLSGGETVYFGQAKAATQFFAEAGFPCPSRRNPSDHFLRCVNADFDRVNAAMKGSIKLRTETEVWSDPLAKMRTSDVRARLIEKYETSEYAALAKKRIDDVSQIEGLPGSPEKGSHSGWWKQLITLTKRSFVNMTRDFGYYWVRIIIYIVVAACVGSIYHDVGTTYTAILARASFGAFVSGFMTFMSIGGFPSFIEEMKLFERERRNGHYGPAVYILSNFFSSLPFLLAVSIVTGCIVYPMVKAQTGFEHFAFFILSLYVGMSIVEGIMMIIASLVPNYLMGIITGAGVIGIMMMTSGFFRLLRDLPKPFWRYPISFMVYGSWALQGGYKNDFLGLEFDPLFSGPKLTGEYVVGEMFGLSLSHSKWVDMGILFVMLLVYRGFIFFAVLVLKEKASPLYRLIYARAFAKRLVKRASFRSKMTSAAAGVSLSKRHQPPVPMAVQEGLSSPIPYQVHQ